MSRPKREVSPPAAVSFLGELEHETYMLLQPKNWAVFQHYKDRCPPWIKLHRDLLNDRVYMRLPIASKAIAPMLWLLASESKDGVFDGSLDELVFRLHITESEYISGVKPLIDNNFFTVVSGVLADRLHEAIPETEREAETETKKEKKVLGKRLASDFSYPKEWEEFCIETRPELHPTRTFDQFKDYWIAQPGQKGVKLDWFATWRNWVRNTNAPKQNPADIVRLTVPSKNEPDAALEKIKADDKKAVPIPLEVLAKMAELRRKA
jgi:hypothetical protein